MNISPIDLLLYIKTIYDDLPEIKPEIVEAFVGLNIETILKICQEENENHLIKSNEAPQLMPEDRDKIIELHFKNYTISCLFEEGTDTCTEAYKFYSV